MGKNNGPPVGGTVGRVYRALEFAAVILRQPNCVPVYPGRRHWRIFVGLCRDADAAGNLISDAWFAALAIERGCEWITLDRDFARFQGLR